MKDKQLLERIRELEGFVPKDKLDFFFDELFAHYLRFTGDNGSSLAAKYEFMCELRTILKDL